MCRSLARTHARTHAHAHAPSQARPRTNTHNTHRQTHTLNHWPEIFFVTDTNTHIDTHVEEFYWGALIKNKTPKT